MSGIYGFMLLHNGKESEYLHPLTHWNRSYGRDASDALALDSAGIGCHLEHLTDRYDCPAPIIHRNHKYAVIDAVLYNREELLSALGREPDSKCADELLLLDFIEENGLPALANVNGDFAGAIFDPEKRSWTLFRDHSGVRPLYYYLDAQTFAFSTDLRGVAAIPGADLRINEEKFYLLASGHNDLSLCGTDYRNIRCIPPASFTTISENHGSITLQEHGYWKWRRKKIRLANDLEYQKELRRLVTDSIQRRLNAFDGIAGCELSGGLDSSVIAILLNRLGRSTVYHSWSESPDIIPLKEGLDERKVILDICSQEQISCHFYEKKPPKEIDTLLKKFEPPFVNTRLIEDGASYLNELGTRVVFTGHGGDEGVSHRCNPYSLWHHHEYADFWKIMYRGTPAPNLRLLRVLRNGIAHIRFQGKALTAPYHRQHSNISDFLKTDFKEKLEHSVTCQPLPFAYDPVSYILQGGQRNRLDNVTYQGAEAGVRYMMPYLDYRVLDFALSIPRIQHTNGYQNRYVYRKAFEDICPESLLKVNYKHSPSQISEDQQDPEFSRIVERAKNELLSFLDREFWKDYLDFEKLENYHAPDQYSSIDRAKVSALFITLTTCRYIQNIPLNIPFWNEENESL